MSWGLVHAQMIRLKFTRIQGHFAFLDSFANFARLQLILLVFGHRALIGNSRPKNSLHNTGKGIWGLKDGLHGWPYL